MTTEIWLDHNTGKWMARENPAGKWVPVSEQLCSIELNGGVRLTPDGAKEALDEAMTIIETVGTTGVHHKSRDAERWMKKYYNQWV